MGYLSFVKKTKKPNKAIIYSLFIALITFLCFLLWPYQPFNTPYSTVLTDKNGELLSVKLAADGQWRFPADTNGQELPEKFKLALLEFEDRHFNTHWGVNPVSLAQAFRANLKAGKVVRGGSTLSMQVIRLARNGQGRTLGEKLLELLLAFRLEAQYSKEEILAMYALHAPFGGNTVGLETACQRYYGRPAKALSWAEAATLAVLPNAPALIFPGKNQQSLEAKRNRLLTRLLANGELDSLSYKLALQEPLPLAGQNFPNIARHLLLRAEQEGQAGRWIQTSLDKKWQLKITDILDRHHQQLAGNQVHNGAVLVLDTKTGEALAYLGNTGKTAIQEHGKSVDIITARRSTGSLLKPFLYAASLQEGRILPNELLRDTPFYQKGFNPQNFDKTFEGAVPANEALARSLNVPFVYLLKEYGTERFHSILKETGLKSLDRPAGHFGLALILGGAEGSLWELTGMYAAMGRSLGQFQARHQQYSPADYREPSYTLADSTEIKLKNSSLLSAPAIWHTFTALEEVNRPAEEGDWRHFSSARRLAWKTGTSFGLRDGWAIGVTPEYTIGVWVGNADGEGRPGLTGLQAAAPILFDVLAALPRGGWFTEPGGDMAEVSICRQSGTKAGEYCPEQLTQLIPIAGANSPNCTFHQLVHLDKEAKVQVSSVCYPISEMQHRGWFSLSPVMEWFYRQKHAEYQPLPPYMAGCEPLSNTVMQLIYPAKETHLAIPRELDGSPGRAVFEVAHRQRGETLFWHLDGNYLGSTQSVHQFAFNPAAGRHQLVVTDSQGERLEYGFEVLASGE